MAEVLDLYNMMRNDVDPLAQNIADTWARWYKASSKHRDTYKEIQQYLFATDTNEIANALEWENTTHIPLIKSMRDTLVANYKNSMFSVSNFTEWEDAAGMLTNSHKKNALNTYTRKMLIESKFKSDVNPLIKDFVDCGNAYVMVTYEDNTHIMPDGTERRQGYSGSKAVRIDPYSVAFDPTAGDFNKAPKVIQSILSMGELKKRMMGVSSLTDHSQEAFKEAMKTRQNISAGSKEYGMYAPLLDESHNYRANQLSIAGFTDVQQYISSDSVELLNYYGDYYDVTTDTLYENVLIVVMDRVKVISVENIPDLGYGTNFFHTAWDEYKGTCVGMSALANLLGMNYRANFVENKKADLLNYLTNPITVETGPVESPETMEPGAKFSVPQDGRVEFKPIDMSALQLNSEISNIKYLMEYSVGAPESMRGIRSQGEKTAFEVETLDSRAAILFFDKILKFEEELLQPLINCMFTTNVYFNKGAKIEIPSRDDVTGLETTVEFEVSSLLDYQGTFVTVGSTVSKERDRVARSLMQLGNSAIYNDEAVKRNYDPNKLGKLMETVTGLERYNIFKLNARADAQALTAVEDSKTQEAVNNEVHPEAIVDEEVPNV